ncbi:hypothetical protein GPECTOR_115g325 [Gonium pectorale]|uniref:Uncharacterized protein n=1 Tax=Gonium pectorale TaxID=33097 RepID=A0A150FYZ7_GONPE|nr:hypothetical protein GPECTOR_115g325 [Gonium pectorale]|eukprot:KXZ42831.1 hypothetical protein GPECTOR_115g325 [Gonium pectorale]
MALAMRRGSERSHGPPTRRTDAGEGGERPAGTAGGATGTAGGAAGASVSGSVVGLPTEGRPAKPSLRLEVRVISSISQVPREEWDAVVSNSADGELNPFLLWSFLNALEESGSAARETGWLPQHVLVREVPAGEQPGSASAAEQASGSGSGSASGSGSGRLVGCVPMYLKGHSYGEYVFDSSWAQYAQMLGVRYYPKLQAAVPFTPVTGPRLVVSAALAPGGERDAVVRALGRALVDMADSLGVSGLHLTFTTASEWAALAELGFKQRLGIQFHWENAGYGSFDDFLADLKQSKRKSIRQERKSVGRAGLAVHRLPGSALGPAHWDRFHDFYLSTVDRKWGNAYLTREFFQRLGEAMPERATCEAGHRGVGGRAPAPWARRCRSGCHYIRDPRLGAVVDQFLRRERGQIEYTLQMMSFNGSPYKRERTVEALVSKLRAYGSLSSSSSASSLSSLEDGDLGAAVAESVLVSESAA